MPAVKPPSACGFYSPAASCLPCEVQPCEVNFRETDNSPFIWVLCQSSSEALCDVIPVALYRKECPLIQNFYCRSSSDSSQQTTSCEVPAALLTRPPAVPTDRPALSSHCPVCACQPPAVISACFQLPVAACEASDSSLAINTPHPDHCQLSKFCQCALCVVLPCEV